MLRFTRGDTGVPMFSAVLLGPGLIARLTIVLLMVAAPAASQDIEAEPTSAPTEDAPSPQWIPAPEIPQYAEQLQQRLRELSEAAAVDPAIERIASELPDLDELSDARFSETATALEAAPSLDQLRDLEAEWSDRLANLSAHSRKLSTRATALETDLGGLASERETWSLTLSHARDTDSPPEVIAAVESNLGAIDRVADLLRDRRATVLSTLTAASQLEQRAGEARERVTAARAAIRSQLLIPDSPPIWSSSFSDPQSRGVESIFDAKSREWAEAGEFLVSRQPALAPIALTFLVALVAARLIRDRLRRRASSDHLEGSAAVFERPMSAAIVLVAAFAAWALPFAPGLVWDLLGVALVYPILRLLTPIVPSGTRAILATLVLFYLVDRVRDLLSSATLLERSIFLAETLAAAIAIAIFLRPSRLAHLANGETVPKQLGTGLRLSLIFLVAATIANALGYVSFAKVLGDGTLGAIYLAILAYAVYRIGLTLVLVAVSSDPLAHVRSISSNDETIMRWARRLLVVGAGSVWLLESLDGFSIRDVAVDWATAFVSTPVEFGTVAISIGSVLAFPLTILAAWLVSSAVREILKEDVFQRVELQRGVGNAITAGLHYALLLGGFFLALGAAGIDLSKFALLAGAFGVGVGFGLQNIVNNFISGLIVLVERPIQVGDMIELGTLLGEVKKIGIRASTIVTFQGAEVIVPNGNLLSEQLINWTLSNENCRIEIPVGVAYGNDPERVKAVLQEVLDAEPRALSNPRPVVLFQGFGDSSLDFELRCWIEDYPTFPVVKSDIASKVAVALERAGIEIPFPQRDLHLKSVDVSVAAALQKPGAPE